MALVLVALLPAAGSPQARAPATPDGATLAPLPSRTATSRAASLDLAFGQLPLYFVENRAQADPRMAYYMLGAARGSTLPQTA